MAAKADEEARRLDQRIAEIRRKNEAILKRRKEIEEDKKLAEEQNAVVQLKPSTEDWPRERTPAMKPSKREMGFGDANNSFQDSPSPRSSGRRERPCTASRGRDLMEKGAGPPPDPRSFLSDPDREWGENSPQSENSRGRPGRNRNESGREREFQEEFHERGGPQRDKFDQRERRGGRRSGGRGGGGDNERGNRRDEAWRVERHKIDEARIQRQRDSDGRWRREWDNEKLDFEVEGDDNKHPALTPSNTVPSKSLGGRLSQWKTSVNKETGNNSNTFKRQSDGANHVPGSAVSHISTPTSSPISLKNDGASVNSKPKVGPLASLERAILSESENFKITIKNKESDRKEERSGRYSRGGKMLNECQPKKRPGILRTSQSSVSDEDTSCPASPAKFTQYENMTFTIRNEPVNIKRSDLEKMSHEDFVKLSQMAKPPLPSFRAPIKKSTENFVQTAAAEEDDDSWEDVTTSGTESLYESGSESVSGTPLKAPTHTGVGNQSQTVPYTPEDFICLVPPEPQNPSTLVTSEHTSSMNVLCHLPPQIITVPMAQGILHHNPQAVIHQSPASVIIEHKPASAIIHQNPASAIIHQNPASAVIHQNQASAIIHQNPASAIIHQNPASAIIHQNPASAIIHQNPASAIIHQVPPPAIIHQKPPSEIIQQTKPSTIMHQNPPPSIIYQNPPPSIIHHNPQPEISHLPQKSFHKQSNMIQVIYSTPPPAFNHQTPPPPIVYQTPPPPITHHTPPPPITHRPPTAASTAVEEIISESIVFMPPNTQTATCKTIDAPPYPYETTTNLETTPNHSFDLDNYIVLVKPDTSFEEKVQLEHMNAQSGHLQTNIGSQTVLPNEVTNDAIVSNNEDVTKDEKLTDKPL